LPSLSRLPTCPLTSPSLQLMMRSLDSTSFYFETVKLKYVVKR
jgi:hypothetical protein